ncbi:MAG TPA: hypothetical protein VJZ26_18150 [Blastocatellia bacterium]|nr:hypothetical protein [Blastocatellia bacterium]
MGDETEELKDRISQMSDGELLRIVGPDRDDYVEEAIQYAARELTVRNIPFEAPQSRAARTAEGDESADAQAIVIPPCDACGGAMRAGWLIADSELTIFLPDTDEERFVQALACSICGEMRLVVDFETDVKRRG